MGGDFGMYLVFDLFGIVVVVFYFVLCYVNGMWVWIGEWIVIFFEVLVVLFVKVLYL